MALTKVKGSVWDSKDNGLGINVKDFGAVGDGTTNDYDAIIAARDYALTNNIALVFPDAVYAFSTTLEFGFQDLKVRAIGEATLKHTGTGIAVSLDAGAVTGNAFRAEFIGFNVEGNANTTDAIFVRSMHHLKLKAKATVACDTGLRVNFAVLSKFDFSCSTNTGTFTKLPQDGIILDQRGVGEQVAYCTFNNIILEGLPRGGQLLGAIGNLFVGGAIEGGGVGLDFGTGSSVNKMIGTDFELNSTADIRISGSSNYNEFYSVDTGLLFYIVAGNANKIFGGQHESVRADAGTENALIHTIVNRNGSGTLAENTPLGKTSVRNNGAGFNYQDTGTYTPLTTAGVTVGASPFLYENTLPYPIELFVSAGTVSQVTFKRGALELVKATSTDMSIYLDPSDECRITYSALPIVNAVPR